MLKHRTEARYVQMNILGNRSLPAACRTLMIVLAIIYSGKLPKMQISGLRSQQIALRVP